MVDMMKIKTECAVCPTKIWKFNGVKLKKTPEYNELDVKLNDLSNMTVGVCSQHLSPKKLELTTMTEKIHQGWLEEVALGVGEEQWVKEKGLKLEVVSL